MNLSPIYTVGLGESSQAHCRQAIISKILISELRIKRHNKSNMAESPAIFQMFCLLLGSRPPDFV